MQEKQEQALALRIVGQGFLALNLSWNGRVTPPLQKLLVFWFLSGPRPDRTSIGGTGIPACSVREQSLSSPQDIRSIKNKILY
jgi:hypothetical protein